MIDKYLFFLLSLPAGLILVLFLRLDESWVTLFHNKKTKTLKKNEKLQKTLKKNKKLPKTLKKNKKLQKLKKKIKNLKIPKKKNFLPKWL